MLHSSIRGVFPVLATPFAADGSLDLHSFTNMIGMALAAGVNGLVFPGLASEYDTLDPQERCMLIKQLGSTVDQRVPFIIGASASEAQTSLLMIESGLQAGAVGAMVMTPANLRDDLDGLIKFYQEVGKPGLPIMLQNAPPPMGIGLAAADVLHIVRNVPEILWVKEENMPCGQRITVLLDGAPTHMEGVFGGAGGRYITDELSRGALGTMPAVELPAAHVALYKAFCSENFEELRSIYESVLPMLMMQAVFRWRLTKEVLYRCGIISHTYTRAVGPELDDKDLSELSIIMDRVAHYLPSPASLIAA
jgi:4-hydroxy-tetrahydrodipicolinate synthase